MGINVDYLEDTSTRDAESLGYRMSSGGSFNRRVVIGKCPYEIGTKEYDAYIQGSMRAREEARLEAESSNGGTL